METFLKISKLSDEKAFNYFKKLNLSTQLEIIGSISCENCALFLINYCIQIRDLNTFKLIVNNVDYNFFSRNYFKKRKNNLLTCAIYSQHSEFVKILFKKGFTLFFTGTDDETKKNNQFVLFQLKNQSHKLLKTVATAELFTIFLMSNVKLPTDLVIVLSKFLF